MGIMARPRRHVRNPHLSAERHRRARRASRGHRSGRSGRVRPPTLTVAAGAESAPRARTALADGRGAYAGGILVGILLAAIMTAGAISSAVATQEGSGDLDVSLGGDGTVSTNFCSHDTAQAVTVDGDGRVIVAGSTSGDCSGSGGDDFAIARYEADGALDTEFDVDGRTTFSFTGPGFDVATAVAAQPDGKIVAAGYTQVASQYAYALARVNADGSLDTSFGTDGRVTTDAGIVVMSLALQEDGKILAVGDDKLGDLRSPATQPTDRLTARSRTAGWPPSTSSSSSDASAAIAVQPNGRIVVVGATEASKPRGV